MAAGAARAPFDGFAAAVHQVVLPRLGHQARFLRFAIESSIIRVENLCQGGRSLCREGGTSSGCVVRSQSSVGGGGSGGG